MIIEQGTVSRVKDEWSEYFSKKALIGQREARLGVKAKLIAYFGGKCVKCEGEFPPVCYDFHHRIPKDKLFTISGQQLILQPWDELVKEASKQV